MDYLFLSKTELFRGSSCEEIKGMLDCLHARRASFKKGEYIYRAGESVRSLGLVLSGSVNIESDDPWGNTSLLGHIAPGEIFAEAYACVPEEPLMVNVLADAPCEILFIESSQLSRPCSKACSHHAALIKNLLCVTAKKNLSLSRRILQNSAKSIRGRVAAYLAFEAARTGSGSVTVPFNRQQLADYLNVDRSALSAELGRMKADGLISFERNHFELKGTEPKD